MISRTSYNLFEILQIIALEKNNGIRFQQLPDNLNGQRINEFQITEEN